MEEVLSRFQHIGEDIFDSLDEGSLEICKNVCKTWKNFIADPNQKFMWIQIIKIHEENAILDIGKLKSFISSPKPKWSKLRIQSLREFANRLNSERDKLNGFIFYPDIQSNNFTLHKIKTSEMFLEKYAELKVELNTKSETGETVFHLACIYDQSKIAIMLIMKSADFKIDLNARDDRGFTGFHYACHYGNIETVEMIIEHAESSKLDFKVKDNDGQTAFEVAEVFEIHDVVDLIKRKLPAGTF